VLRSSLLYVWVTGGPFGRLTKSLCDFGDMTPHTLVGGAQTRPHGKAKGQRSGIGRIVETTQGRPGDLEGTPSPGPQRLLIGARGSQGPSVRVRPATRGTIPDPQWHCGLWGPRTTGKRERGRG
jgi:hypothetical protein